MAKYVMRVNIPRWETIFDRQERILGFVLCFLKENGARSFVINPHWNDDGFVYIWEIKFKLRAMKPTLIKYVIEDIQDAIDSDRKRHDNGLEFCTLSKE